MTDGRTPNPIKLLFCALACCLLIACRQHAPVATFQKIKGPTMGTYYECTFKSHLSASQIQHGMDSLFDLMNATASTYIPTSFISEFNAGMNQACRPIESSQAFHMQVLMKLSDEIVDATDGFFDPSLMPLINYWGFGYKKRETNNAEDTSEIINIMRYVGFKHVQEVQINDNYCLVKDHPKTELDMNAVAKGYAVDLMAEYLKNTGSQHYYVNIGGEVVTRGLNEKGNPWTLGINYPDTAADLRELYASIQISDGAMASSGNYRNYYTEAGKLYAHTINPISGRATPSDLIAVTIVADYCATADAYATACMAMGYELARSLVEAHPDLEGFFIYKNDDQMKLEYYATPKLLNTLKFNK
jgi:thiamine biosynthesis lipoprotein